MSDTIPDNDSSTKPKEPLNAMGASGCTPAPPPFDPLTLSATIAAAGVGESIVPDLMRIYESLTQSKTPDVPSQVLQQQSENIGKLSSNGYVPEAANFSASSKSEGHVEGYGDYPPPAGYGNHEQNGMTPPPYSHQATCPYQAIPANRSTRKRSTPIPPFEDVPRVEVDNTFSSAGSVDYSYGGAKRRKPSKKDEKMQKDKDGRWSKRFTWPEDLHRDFVASIFDVGLKHSSPSTVLEQMTPHEQVTTERVKSHLQKYRLHRQKSKKEFMTEFESTLHRLRQTGYDGIDTLSGGKVAGQAAFATMTNQSTNALSKATTPDMATKLATEKEISPPPLMVSHQQPTKDEISPEMLVLPRLTEEEKSSPIGASMGYLMGLFFSLKQQLDMQRQHQDIVRQQQEASAVAAANVNVNVNIASQSDIEQQDAAARVYDSFVKGLPTADSDSPEYDEIVAPANVASNVAVTLSPGGLPSTRNNLEENNIMKREMKNQMAFQSKMRALKQQEQSKYKMQFNYASMQDSQDNPPRKNGRQRQSRSELGSNASHEYAGQITPPSQPQEAQEQYHYIQQRENEVAASFQDFQGAGEVQTDDAPGGNDEPRQYSLSMGEEDDFWNTDVVDDQLFQFLMNN